MSSELPNLDEMDIEEFEQFIKKKRSKHHRSRSPQRQLMKLPPQEVEVDDLEKRLEMVKKQAEEAAREDCTVLVQRLHIKATERDVYQFFASAGVGKVRDVRIIRDQRTLKSKGVAYVEFFTPDSVLKSMVLSGQLINGQSIMVQPSQAERSRAAAAQKSAKLAESQLALPKEGPNKIFVAGINDLGLTPRDLRQLFMSYGEIEHVMINRGVGYIQYRNSKDAKEAATRRDKSEIRGKRIRVGMADSKASIREAQSMGDHEEDGTYIRSRSSKQELRQHLARGTDLGGELPPGIESKVPTNTLLLINLWDFNELNLSEKPNFFKQIHDNVLKECKSFGQVSKIFVERNSKYGYVWVCFGDLMSAKRAQMKFHGRFFDRRQIKAVFTTEMTMNAHMKQVGSNILSQIGGTGRELVFFGNLCRDIGKIDGIEDWSEIGEGILKWRQIV